MLRHATLGVLLLLIACSSPSTSPLREGTPPGSTLAVARDEHREAPLKYRLVIGTTSTRVLREASTVTTTVGGDALPDSTFDVSARVTASVLEPRDGAYVVEYRLDEMHVDLGVPHSEHEHMLQKAANELTEQLRGRSHARTVTPLGASSAIVPMFEGFADTVMLQVVESFQLPHFADDTRSVGTRWSDCIADYDPEESDGDFEMTCTVTAIEDGMIEIETVEVSRGGTKRPSLDGVPEEEIVVTAAEAETRCVYHITLVDPVPISRDCHRVAHKSGSAGEKPFTYEKTEHFVIEISDDETHR